jgi:hypothetical protein
MGREGYAAALLVPCILYDYTKYHGSLTAKELNINLSDNKMASLTFRHRRSAATAQQTQCLCPAYC